MAAGWGLPVVAWPGRLRPNKWDLAAFPIVVGLLALFAYGSGQMSTPYQVGDSITISLDPARLPGYALRTVLRMFAALVVSLIFSLCYAAAAAKSRRAEKVLVPILDILQSVPILGFLTITVTAFIALFPGNLLGVECASIFAVFTSQAWNITFSLYQSFRTVPVELGEAARMYHLGPWARFWRLEVPHAMPGLVWNMMMSVSGGWFFVVASEAITVHGQTIALPGIGSYIDGALHARDVGAILWAVFTMLIVILIYDQLLFRPLLAWSQKFKNELQGEEALSRPWFLILLQRANMFELLGAGWNTVREAVSRHWHRTAKPTSSGLPVQWLQRTRVWRRVSAIPAPALARWTDRLFDGVMLTLAIAGGIWLINFILTGAAPDAGPGTEAVPGVTLDEVGHVFLYATITAIRVLVLIVLASLFWVPIGVWIGLRPGVARRAQPIVQFMAAFPANLFFPLAAYAMKNFNLNVEIWCSPLMILGTQWYILFNVIGGASGLSSDLRYVSQNLSIRGRLWWKRVILPAIFPAYITGALTAAGGSWNASIVSEVVKWGDDTYRATGIGRYISDATDAGDFRRVALGVAVLSLYVVLFNRLFWRRLYDVAAERLRMD